MIYELNCLPWLSGTSKGVEDSLDLFLKFSFLVYLVSRLGNTAFFFWSSKMRSWFQQGPRKRQKKLGFALAPITCTSQYLWFLVVYSWWEHQRLFDRNIYFQKFNLLGFFSSLNSLVKEKRAASLETLGKNWQKKRTNKIPKKSKSGGKENHKACNMNR